MANDQLKNKIVEIAKRYVGKKEVSGNLGFIDHSFEESMINVGWKIKESWCAYFAELVWTLAIGDPKNKLYQKISQLCSSGAVATYNNYKADKSKLFEVDSKPQVGDIVIWQHYENGVKSWQGHAGIVITVNADGSFQTIEGNTNSTGGREGIEVAIKNRKIAIVSTGLNVLGFIRIK